MQKLSSPSKKELSALKIGVLAMQGASHAHAQAIDQLGARAQLVRKSEELANCDALILPGGESTAIAHLLKARELWEPLREFVKHHPVFGTCAGLILLARQAGRAPFTPFGVIDVDVQRNGYGPQCASFVGEIHWNPSLEPASLPHSEVMRAPFIRAPRIACIGSRVTVIGRLADSGEPVLVQQGLAIGATYHAELTGDLRLHQAFCSLILSTK